MDNEPMDGAPQRPVVRIMLGTVGGQGGGLLSNWLVRGLLNSGWQAQMVGVLGLSQRAGTVTYYIETSPRDQPSPVYSAYPTPGDVDIVVGSELLELGRQLQAGYAHRESVVIADVRRMLATLEKMPAADGVYDAQAIVRAAGRLSSRPFLVDTARLLRRRQLPQQSANAVLLGMIAAASPLRLPADGFLLAITSAGTAVSTNQEAFRLGYELMVAGEVPAEFGPAVQDEPAWQSVRDDRRQQLSARDATAYDELLARAERLPVELMSVLPEALYRLIDYQDPAYATEFLDLVESMWERECTVTAGPTPSPAVTVPYARHLATWMTVEDVARVAQLKTRPQRLAAIRRRHGADGADRLIVVDYLSPDVGYVSHVLPARLARPARRVLGLLWPADRTISLRWPTSSPAGYWIMRGLAALRRIRRHTEHFRTEAAERSRWERSVIAWLARDRDLAVVAADAGDLVKGYARVRQEALADLWALVEEFLPAVAGLPGSAPADAVDLARALLRELRTESGSAPRARRLLDEHRLGTPDQSPAARTG